MKERPILFSGPMVSAILEGRKKMTRRVVKPQPFVPAGREYMIAWHPNKPVGSPPHTVFETNSVEYMQDEIANSNLCPYGQPCDRLWVRETWRVGAWNEERGLIAADYRASPDLGKTGWIDAGECFENLWIQSSEDAEKAGIPCNEDGAYKWESGQSPCRWRPSIFMPRWASRITLELTAVRVERLQEISEDDAVAEGVERFASGWKNYTDSTVVCQTARASFHTLWDSLNAKRGYGWDSNPWVWVLSFKVV